MKAFAIIPVANLPLALTARSWEVTTLAKRAAEALARDNLCGMIV